MRKITRGNKTYEVDRVFIGDGELSEADIDAIEQAELEQEADSDD